MDAGQMKTSVVSFLSSNCIKSGNVVFFLLLLVRRTGTSSYFGSTSQIL